MVYVYTYTSLVKLKPDLQSLLQEAAQISQMERGKLCVMREGPTGPFYNHQYREQGKNVSRYVPREQVPAVQEAIDGFAKFQGLIEEYVDQVVEKSRGEIAAGLKKKKVRPRSSSPRTPRSGS
jgi:hypothetical protein